MPITANEYARCDEACKRVLAEKVFLARILKGCVEEYFDCPVDDIMNKYIDGEPEISETPTHRDPEKIIGSDSEDSSLHESTIRYDLKFRASLPGNDGKIALIINIEAQRRFDPGYPLVKRGLYYCCRLVSAQYGTEFTHSHYEDIKKVYSIWLCFDAPETRKNTIIEYSINEKSLVGKAGEKPENYDLLRTIIVCPGENSEHGSMLRLLNVLFSNKMLYREKKELLNNEFNIELNNKTEEEVTEMCNLSYGIAERSLNEGMQKGIMEGMQKGIMEGMQKGIVEGMQKGIVEGMQKGIVEGMQKGIVEGMQKGIVEGIDKGVTKNRLESLHALMSQLNIDFDRAADLLLIPASDRENLRKLLDQQ